MAQQSPERGSVQSGDEAQSSSLKVLFPGETVELTGQYFVTVKPWGVKDLSGELPSILGKLAQNFMGVKDALVAGATEDLAIREVLISSTDLIVQMAAHAARMKYEELQERPLGDLIRLVRVMLAQNADFFVQFSALYAEVKSELPRRRGSPPQPTSDKQDGASTN